MLSYDGCVCVRACVLIGVSVCCVATFGQGCRHDAVLRCSFICVRMWFVLRSGLMKNGAALDRLTSLRQRSAEATGADELSSLADCFVGVTRTFVLLLFFSTGLLHVCRFL